VLTLFFTYPQNCSGQTNGYRAKHSNIVTSKYLHESLHLFKIEYFFNVVAGSGHFMLADMS